MAELPATDLEDQLRRYADAVEAAHGPAVRDDNGEASGDVPAVPGAAGPRGPGLDAPIDEVRKAPPAPAAPHRRGRFLLAAATVVLAVVGVLTVAVPRGDDRIDAGDGSSLSEPPNTDPGSFELPSEDEARQQCRDEVSQSLGETLTDDDQVAVQEIPGLNARKVMIVSGDKMFACTVGGGQMLAQMEFGQIDASEIAPGTISIRGSGGDGVRRTVSGRVGEGVVAISGQLPDGSTFPGIVVGPWFVLDVVVDPDLPPNEDPAADLVVSWQLASGERRASRVDFLTPVGGGTPCAATPDCLAARVAEIQTEAANRQASAASFTQGPALADGVITEDEFDTAMATFVDCSVASGLSGYVAPASRFRDWAILTRGGDDPGRALGYGSLLWLRPTDLAAVAGSTTSIPPDPYIAEACKTAHIDLISTLVSLQDEKRRYDENAALPDATTTPTPSSSNTTG